MKFKIFLKDETGAIMTDWVALTSALVIAAMVLIFSLFSGGVSPLTNTLNQQIEAGSAELCGDGTDTCDQLSM